MIKKQDGTNFYIALSVGSAVGLLASFLQTVEKITLLNNKDSILACDLGSLFSCSAVLTAPQSSLFGFPNSLLCIVFFTTLLASGLVGLSGGLIGRRMLQALLGLTVFMILFAMWFLFTSTFVIGAICIFCLFCFAGLLIACAALLRLNGAMCRGGKCDRFTRRNVDVILWISLALILGTAIIIRFFITY